MKVIDIEEARSNLERYADECRTAPIVVTIAGQPAFEMLPIRTDDPEFIDRLIETNAEFRAVLEQRQLEQDQGRTSSIEDVRKRLGV